MNNIKKRIFFRNLHHSSFLLPYVMEFYYHPFRRFLFFGQPIVHSTRTTGYTKVQNKNEMPISKFFRNFLATYRVEFELFIHWYSFLCILIYKQHCLTKVGELRYFIKNTFCYIKWFMSLISWVNQNAWSVYIHLFEVYYSFWYLLIHIGFWYPLILVLNGMTFKGKMR